MTRTVTPWTEQSVAAELAAAEHERRDVERFTATWTDLTVPAGYRIQAAGIERRLAAGRRRVGVKLGLTSFAKQRQMGVDSPLVGILTDDMVLAAGADLVAGELIHPRVEPEFAFVMAADLSGADCDAGTARAAVGRVHGAIEVIDSRYRDFDFRLPDVVADNASSARFVIDPAGVDPDDVDLVNESVTLSLDGETVAQATGAAVLGDPYLALAYAAVDLATRGDGIRAGEIVLSGALTDARAVVPGTRVLASFPAIGDLPLRVR
jgi:2-oxo-3-hexenedioate decarboxylase